MCPAVSCSPFSYAKSRLIALKQQATTLVSFTLRSPSITLRKPHRTTGPADVFAASIQKIIWVALWCGVSLNTTDNISVLLKLPLPSYDQSYIYTINCINNWYDRHGVYRIDWGSSNVSSCDTSSPSASAAQQLLHHLISITCLITTLLSMLMVVWLQ